MVRPRAPADSSVTNAVRRRRSKPSDGDARMNSSSAGSNQAPRRATGCLDGNVKHAVGRTVAGGGFRRGETGSDRPEDPATQADRCVRLNVEVGPSPIGETDHRRGGQLSVMYGE